jgi:predicted glycogen debranching enzyme
MVEPVRRIPWRTVQTEETDPHLTNEWLVTNGLGGYASGTVSGISTRRYHGLLIAALPAPLGRVMMLSDVSEHVRLPDRRIVLLGGDERVSQPQMEEMGELLEFRLEAGLPVWTYQVDDFILEKRLLLLHGQNTVHINYRLLSGPGAVRLQIRPAVHFRHHDASLPLHFDKYSITIVEDTYEISAGPELPSLRLLMYGDEPVFSANAASQKIHFRTEEHRGYAPQGERWSPGYFRVNLAPGRDAAVLASTESWEMVRALGPAEALRAERMRRSALIAAAHPSARDGTGGELVLAADQFIISPTGRIEDTVRARAAGDEVRTVIAGYHWFTDWGRDTMISLEGLTLTTGRKHEAGWILRTFSHYVRDGLLPNMFPDGRSEGLYHTADATLWFFHAIDRYLQATNDRITLELILPKLKSIIEHHVAGTRFGIGIDPNDGLLSQGEQGYQLTWMDAKVDDWVVTPRRGKPVEINALWYNALRLLETWLREVDGEAAAQPLGQLAEQASRSFNERFWHEAGGYLYDVVDGPQGNDASCRPNQVFAISLPNPVLDEARWQPVMNVVCERLLTPVGLRTLAPGEPDYKAKYYGDLRARDAAYHQGTAWPWLIGPFVDAWLKVHPDDRAGARRFLEAFTEHLGEACVGSISEIFDAETPYTPRGCIAQAWSVAEVLRCWVKTAA